MKKKHASCEEEAWYFLEEDVVPVSHEQGGHSTYQTGHDNHKKMSQYRGRGAMVNVQREKEAWYL